MTFECVRCGYSTKIKTNIKKHFNRKHICPPIFGDITIQYMYQLYNIK